MDSVVSPRRNFTSIRTVLSSRRKVAVYSGFSVTAGGSVVVAGAVVVAAVPVSSGLSPHAARASARRTVRAKTNKNFRVVLVFLMFSRTPFSMVVFTVYHITIQTKYSTRALKSQYFHALWDKFPHSAHFHAVSLDGTAKNTAKEKQKNDFFVSCHRPTNSADTDV